MPAPKRRFTLRDSLTLWKRRLTFREGRLAAAHKAKNTARIGHWTPLVKDAQKRVDQRTAQLRKRRPLRLKAWDQMQHLIDLKVTEEGGNNHGYWVEKIIRANGGTPGEPWCGDTVAYCYLQAGCTTVIRAWASVRLLLAAGHRAQPRRGDVVRYKFDHTGLFDRWAPERGAGAFWAGEGNTGNAGAQSDSVTGGDGVKLKLRTLDQVNDFRWVAR